MVIKGVPFYANPDGTHCFQAVLRMILGFFQPEKTYTWEELDIISAKEKDLWTWPMAGELWLQTHGFKVRTATMFDYERFVAEGTDYLISKNGKAVAQEQISHSNIPNEQERAKEFIARATIEKRVPVFKDIYDLLNDGWLVICNVNSRRLNKLEGFTGHFVLVIGYEDDKIILHDPGGKKIKGAANRQVPHRLFASSWADPSEDERVYCGKEGCSIVIKISDL